MSVSTLIKDQVKRQIQSCPSVQQVYGHEELDPSGWPAVMLTATDMQGEFISNLNNSRVYAYKAEIFFPIGQDMPGLPAGSNRMEYAEQVIATVIDEIINAVDTSYMLEGTPVLYANAADVTWAYTSLESGETRSAELQLRIYTEYKIQ